MENKTEKTKGITSARLVFYRPLFWTLVAPGSGLFFFGKKFRACFILFLWGLSVDGLITGLFILDNTYGSSVAYTSFLVLVLIYFVTIMELLTLMKKARKTAEQNKESTNAG